MARRLPGVLLVEGPDDREVVYRVCNHHGIDNRSRFDVQACDGFDGLEPRLRVLLKGAALDAVPVVFDADDGGRWCGVRDRFREAGFVGVPADLPADGFTAPAAGFLPRIGAWQWPRGGRPGVLEDLLVATVPVDEPLLTRARAAVDAIPPVDRRFGAAKLPKAVAHTWLAWQEEPGSTLATAIDRGYFRADHESIVCFAAWIRSVLSP